MATPEVIAKLLVESSVIYSIEIKPELFGIWEKLLKDRSDEKIIEAFTEHFQNERFFPKPCEILKLSNPNRTPDWY